MDLIKQPNDDFSFNKLILSSPLSIGGNIFQMKITFVDSNLYIQTPKCLLKNGITKVGKKMYCDLLFSTENEQFIRWLEHLETNCQNQIFDNKQNWFETDLEKHDIENSFNSILKLCKSGKYFNIRVNVPCVLGKANIKIFDEDETSIDEENIQENKNIICILEIKGVKCSSKNFHLEIEVKQMLILNEIENQDLFEKCILKNKIQEKNEKTEKTEKINNTEKKLENLEITREIQDKIEDTEKIINKKPFLVETENNIQIEPLINTDKHIEKETDTITTKNEKELKEIQFNLEELKDNGYIHLKTMKEIYNENYEIYKDTIKKAIFAKDLAIAFYTEYQKLKEKYSFEKLIEEEEFEKWIF